MPADEGKPKAWWVIHEDDLRQALTRAAAGDDPDTVLLELYANSAHEDYREGPDAH